MHAAATENHLAVEQDAEAGGSHAAERGSPGAAFAYHREAGNVLSRSAPSWAGTGWRAAFGSVLTVSGLSIAGAVTTTASRATSSACAGPD